MPYGQQKNEFEWNLLNALRTDVIDDAIYLFGSTHTLFGSTHITVGATLFYPTTIYDSHYLIVVRHNLGKTDYVLK